MTQAAKKQRVAIGRIRADGSFEELAKVDAPFVSSRLGPDVPCETEHEQDDEDRVVAHALKHFGGVGQ